MISPTIVIICLVFLGIWLAVITILFVKQKQSLQLFLNSAEKKDLLSVFNSQKKQIEMILEKFTTFETVTTQMQNSMKSHFQKIGYIRYNPFGNTGGDQSFCLCFLDAQNNGILITSLHARDQTRIYTKQIIDGEPEESAALSKEEAESLKLAKKGKIK